MMKSMPACILAGDGFDESHLCPIGLRTFDLFILPGKISTDQHGRPIKIHIAHR